MATATKKRGVPTIQSHAAHVRVKTIDGVRWRRNDTPQTDPYNGIIGYRESWEIDTQPDFSLSINWYEGGDSWGLGYTILHVGGSIDKDLQGITRLEDAMRAAIPILREYAGHSIREAWAAWLDLADSANHIGLSLRDIDMETFAGRAD